MENLRPGNMDRLQLGYEDLQKVNRGIILASTSGSFESDLPKSTVHAYLAKDMVLVAHSRNGLDMI